MSKQRKKPTPQPVGNKAVIGQTMKALNYPTQVGATKKKNLVVNYLLLNMARLMLASLAPDDKFTRAVQETADQTRGRLRASHTDEELAPINLMSDTAVAMAKKLAGCDSVDALEASLDYMNKLLAGEVYITADVENPEDHGLTPNQ